MPAPHHSVFYRLDALPATQPTASKHWRFGESVIINVRSTVVYKIIFIKANRLLLMQKEVSRF